MLRVYRPVDEADVIEVKLMSEGDFCESSRRWTAGTVAGERTAAISGGAATTARSVECAAVATPEAAGPKRWELKGVGFVSRKLKSTAGEYVLAGAGLDAWPHWISAFVEEYYRWSWSQRRTNQHVIRESATKIFTNLINVRHSFSVFKSKMWILNRFLILKKNLKRER